MAQDKSKSNPWEDFQRDIDAEIEQTRQAHQEVSRMLEQSQAELARLAQRNTAVAGHVQQVQANLENVPRADIRVAYTAALDTQQRLLVMRGQTEKIQSDQASLGRYITYLEKVQRFVNEQVASQSARTGPSSLEMAINAQEAERQRLSRQMHDGPAQALSNFIVQVEIVTRLFDIDPAKAKAELSNLRTSAMTTFQQVRGFIFDLRPMMLDDLGLIPTLRRYVDTYKEQTGCEAVLTVTGAERRFEPYVEVMIFRAVQELMGNAVRFNQDNSVRVQIKVHVAIDENYVRVAVADNGKGFDPQSASDNGFGHKLIRERAEMLGGYFEVESRPSQGCRVSFQVPAVTAAMVKYV